MELLRQFIKRLKRNTFYKNIFLIGSATFLGQLIGVLTIPLITRIYSPGNMGLLGTFMAVTSVGAIFSTLNYENAILVSTKERETRDIIFLSLGLTGMFFLLSSLIIQIIPFNNFSNENIKELAEYKWLIPFGFAMIGLFKIFLSLNIKIHAYKSIAKVRLIQSIFQNFFQLFLGIVNMIPLGLFIGYLVGQAGGISLLMKPFFKNKLECSVNNLLQSARKYVKFPVFSAPGTLLNALNLHAPVIILTFFYELDIVGYFVIIHKILAVPVNLFSKSSATVFNGRIAELYRERSVGLRGVYYRYLKQQSIVSIPVLVLITSLLFFFFAMLLGKEWNEGRNLVWPVALIFLSKMPATSINNVLNIMERQKEHLFQEVIKVSFYIAAALLISQITPSPLEAIFLISIAAFLGYSSYIVVVCRSVDKQSISWI